MAKRFADSQITRETFKENDSGSDEDNSGHKLASAAVMSKRKIAMPKKKMASFQKKQPEPLIKPIDAPASSFSFLKDTKIPDGDSEKYAKMKALNLQFREKVTFFIDRDPFADLSPVCEKYKIFVQSLNTAGNIPAKNTASESQKPLTQQKLSEAQESSDEEEMKEVKVEGPTFTIDTKPPTSDSVFSFRTKKKAENEADHSDSDSVEIKGPQFTFAGSVKSDVFKFSTPSNKQKDLEVATATVEPKEPPAFSLKTNDSLDTPKEKPKFSLGGAGESKENKTPPTSEQQKDAKEISKRNFDFSFSANKANTNGTSETKKPSFSFTFGAGKVGEDVKSDKPAAPTFSFGEPSQGSGNSTETKPAFLFGKSSQDSGSKAESKPAFSFGTSNQESDEKAEAKPVFSFGAPNSSTAPSFTFGKPETTDKQNKSPENLYGAKSGFKFALPFEKRPKDPEVDKNNESIEPPAQETTENGPQEESKPIDLQNGEEDETPLFSQRSKLMIFNPDSKSYDSKGVGEMKLLQSKEDKSKIRFLCRSDGMGNILLNTRVLKDFTYSPLTAENENLVKVPTIEADNKLVTYIVKFKQKADGRQFVKAIEDVKKDL
ncbi:hypothetical protein HG536_0F03010 [Torulaspora globosa]|uniref:RanBD1 domain-containing protein n=1 Tax=Torulaspora globosa TaxID=48254 RepID=A0A7G3ZKE0_9SACH|nr:uncharacterized protein HG536_0F03010 [Torulaspora globosa]QLL33976.1 hypothetical protein HG536_0F03010 [Torulaspora globosa]